MPRLIDADKVADFVCSVCGDNCDDECRRVCLERQFTEKCAEKMPTVDAEPVRQGHWIEIHDLLFDYIRCSECGEDWCTEDNDTETFNYCPNCGAEMDEVRNE